ncbi:hypothetical protein MMC21_006947 [Puttea exsequens]|nr:hypothetical protein [Puttea exsequens]
MATFTLVTTIPDRKPEGSISKFITKETEFNCDSLQSRHNTLDSDLEAKRFRSFYGVVKSSPPDTAYGIYFRGQLF